jgi:hypothetical protein
MQSIVLQAADLALKGDPPAWFNVRSLTYFVVMTSTRVSEAQPTRDVPNF